MVSLGKLWCIAVFEAKILWRSWFFRIFTLLVLVILVLLDVAMFALPSSNWMYRGVGSSIPYMNLLLMNISQAVIGVFLASEFLKFDQKLDTTESIYARSMSNVDYVLGKTLGVLMVFMGLNYAVLAISFIFNYFFVEVPVIGKVYLYYPLLISLPTLLFVFGLSFLFMVLIRNQAVTFIVLLGYIALTLFFLGVKFHGLLDYMAFNLPLLYSEFVGFGDLKPILLHQGIYLALGFGCVFATVLMFRRLPQSRLATWVSGVFMVIFITAGVVTGIMYCRTFSEISRLRVEMAALNRDAIEKPAVSLSSCILTVTHLGKEIEAETCLSFTNKTNESIDRLIFTLNPGFSLLGVMRGSESLQTDRKLHLFTVRLPSPLEPGASDSLRVSYRGALDSRGYYLDIDEEIFFEPNRFWLYSVAKCYGFTTPDYVLLTRESLWYPTPGVPYGSCYPRMKGKDFVNFELRVKTLPGLTAISQGAMTSPRPGEFAFKPEVPLPQISLIIGRYAQKSVTVNDIEYCLLYMPGHDYYSKYFTSIGKTLPDLIRQNLDSYERRMNLTYPYPRLTLVEVPVQFFDYPRIWTLDRDTVQPEQVFIHEKGIYLNNADFKRSQYFTKQMSKRSGETLTPEEAEGRYFNGFVQSNLTGSIAGRNFPDSRGVRISDPRRGSMGFMIAAGGPSIPPAYDIFPQFYSFVNHIRSEKWPIFNTAMEFYLKRRIESVTPFRFMSGLTNEEEANRLLADESLAGILADPSKKKSATDVLRNKCTYLFLTFQNIAGINQFKDFVTDFLYEEQFRETDLAQFLDKINEQFAYDTNPYLEPWYTEKGLPAFVFSNFKCYEKLEKNRTIYHVLFTVTNCDKTEGLLSVSFLAGGSRVGGGRREGRSIMMGPGGGGSFMMMMDASREDSRNTRLISLKGSETKEVGMVFDDPPRMVMVNTVISRNLPVSFSRNFGKPETGGPPELFEGERVLEKPLSPAETGEILVDNEDSGFRIVTAEKETSLKRYLKMRNRDNGNVYAGFMMWNPPPRWRLTVQEGFFGTYRHTGYFVRSGSGAQKALWETEIQEGGKYEVYYYIAELRMSSFGRRSSGSGGERRRTGRIEDFQFLVHHDDGVQEVILDVGSLQPGWNTLGIYYLSVGKAVVELSDKSKGSLVYADAVKWVRR